MNHISRADVPVSVDTVEFPLPPAPLQYHVFSRQVSDQEFLQVGKQCAESLEAALARQGWATVQFDRILDFGCGCARVLRHFGHLFAQREFHGSDIVASVVAWDRQNIAGVRFHQNDANPPLQFPDSYFDYLWSISVFSHLPEEMGLAWIQELRRVLKPGGVALVTVHGEFRFEEDCNFGALTAEARAEYERNDFTYARVFSDGILPDWYQNAYMREPYARRIYGRYFDVIDYLPRGMAGRQDIVVLRRP
jgi:SAM-dependent methyltransferase